MSLLRSKKLKASLVAIFAAFIALTTVDPASAKAWDNPPDTYLACVNWPLWSREECCTLVGGHWDEYSAYCNDIPTSWPSDRSPDTSPPPKPVTPKQAEPRPKQQPTTTPSPKSAPPKQTTPTTKSPS